MTVQVVRQPDPMIAYGQAYLVYELILANYDSSAVELDGIRVTDAEHPDILSWDFSGDPLSAILTPVGSAPAEKDPRSIASGESRIVFVWLKLNPARIPRRLSHTVRYRVKRGNENVEDEIVTTPVSVDDAPPLTIGPPLKGGDWLVNGGPDNASYHRRAHMALGGVVHFAQRFAIDYENGWG